MLVPNEFYIIFHWRTQIPYPRANINIPPLPPQFIDFEDVYMLRNRMLVDVIGIVVHVSPVMFHMTNDRNQPYRDVVLMNIE